MADMLLPVTVMDQPIRLAIQPGGLLRERVRRAVDMGVVRICAGPEKCHITIDVKRPYSRGIPSNIHPQQ